MRSFLLSIFTLLSAYVFLQSFAIETCVVSKYELGKKLFEDPILSEDKSISCSSCHLAAFAFSDTLRFSVGVHGKLTSRNTPSITNMASRNSFFWDGRVETLAEQALFPIANPMEMNLPISEAVARLSSDPFYSASFQALYNTIPNAQNLGETLAAFVETLETNAPFDAWINGNEDAISARAIRGRDLFMFKAKCFDCHFGPDFTGDEFKSIGLYNGLEHNDRGRFEISKDSLHLGAFKVPGLRNVAITGPYMHDGSMRSLAEVIEYYDDSNKRLPNGINRDTILKDPLGLTAQEKLDLEAFLVSLTDGRFVR
ncbi:MAG: cytochrome c peroxidase [Saprospiraceae bacterium]